MKAEICMPEYGSHNKDMPASIKRLAASGPYRDQSTIVIIPTMKSVPAKVVQYWMNLINPPNQKVARIFALGMEVGEAYSQTIDQILSNPDLSTFKYLLTIEHDNCPPPDGFLKLLEAMDAHPEYSVIGGLYWTKGEGGVPQIWGNPKEMPLNFRPQAPVPGEIVECSGSAMGFHLWRLEMFRDSRLRKPWFKTLAEWTPGKGSACFSQDLYFWEDARKYGYRCAVDCRITVGHYDSEADRMW